MVMEVPAEILARYLEHRKQDLEDCLAFLSTHEYQKLEHVGHQLKGNGSMFGHPELSAIGLQLEQAARAHDLNRLERTLRDFSRWVAESH
jgi:HPt (histidine-containing phosphotransfer) domain-containing protein